MTFKNWILSTGLSKASAKKYEGAIYGSISNWANEAGLIKSNLINIDNPDLLSALYKSIIQLPIFKERNTVGNNMYSAAINKYLEYLNFCQSEVEDDIMDINSDKSISKTEKESLVKSRFGQGVFRDNLFEYWKGCAVTGYKSPKLLIASHIKPWRISDNVERLDPFNGLMLIPNLDKAFDKGFISFKKNGDIIFSELFLEPEKLGIKNDMKIKVNVDHQFYLEYHREMILLNINS